MNGPLAGSGFELAYALAGGLLIGLERGWSQREQLAGSRVASFRTFGLIGLAGGVAGLLPGWAGGAILAGVGLIVSIGYWRFTLQAGRLSATDAVAAMTTLGLGELATRGQPSAAVAVAAVVALLLSMRETTHRWLRGMSEAELRAATRFALIALVIWPIAPDAAMGPMGAWNPHKLWFVVVLVSGLSFLGYFIGRRAEASKSIMLTAACGAIVSSTAVTATCARRLKHAENGDALSGAIALATVVMLLRMLFLTILLVPTAAPYLGLILLPGCLLLLKPAALGLRAASRTGEPAPFLLSNPLELGVALGLAVLIAVIALAAKWAIARFGHLGLATVITITGLVDVDAAIMTLGGTDLGTITAPAAGMILAGPMLANNALKAALTVALAPNRQGSRTALWLAASAVVSAAMLGLLILA